MMCGKQSQQLGELSLRAEGKTWLSLHDECNKVFMKRMLNLHSKFRNNRNLVVREELSFI